MTTAEKPRSNRTHNAAVDITPAQLGRKFVKRADKALRDAPAAYTPDGKRIYAYNDEGIPICFSKRPGEIDPETGENKRCQSIACMYNGRCMTHGGKSLKGEMHPQATHLRTSESLPQHMRADMHRALMDPDLLSLDHEIGLVDLQVKGLKGELCTDVDFVGAKAMDTRIQSLKAKRQNGADITEEDIDGIVATWINTQSTRATYSRLHVCYEMRRKLVDTAARREQQLKMMIRADQAIALVTSLAAACRECIDNYRVSIEKHYYLIDKQNAAFSGGDGKSLREKMVEIEAPGIDKAYTLDFLSAVSTALGALIGQAREAIVGLKDQREKGLFAANTILPDLEHPYVPGTKGKRTGAMNRANKILALERGEG